MEPAPGAAVPASASLPEEAAVPVHRSAAPLERARSRFQGPANSMPLWQPVFLQRSVLAQEQEPELA
jgi:hypothetical protein